MVNSEIRLVGLIVPETSWGTKVNANDEVLIAKRGQTCEYAFCHVGPMRGESEKRMIKGLVTWPEHTSLKNWTVFIYTILIARLKRPLFFDDFAHKSTLSIDFKYLQ